MSDSLYAIRNFRPEDFSGYVRLNAEVEKVEPTGRRTSPQVLSERLGQPGYLPERDLFIAEVAGEVIGYMDVRPELGIGRVLLDCLVHPRQRRKGVATALFRYAIRRAGELGASLAHVNVAEDNAAAKGLLSKLGFRFVRRFLELRLELSKVHLPEDEELALPCRHLQRGEEDKLAEMQNRAFADTWGYNPNTVEEVVYRLNAINRSPEDVILVCKGDKAVGYCWTATNVEEQAAGATNKGRVYMLGVDPDHQAKGKGIGKRVLLAGLAHLKSKGIEVVELTVDSENEAACALYESVGFKVSSTSVWYEKAVAYHTGAT